MKLIAFVFPKLRTLKMWLDKCLKSLVLEEPWRSNMVNVPKDCSYMHHITFIRFIDHYEVNSVVFPKSPTLKTWLDKCLKSPIWEDPSISNMVNVPKHCSNLHQITFYQIHWSLPSQWSWKNSLLLTWQILGLLVNPLAADEKYPVS